MAKTPVGVDEYWFSPSMEKYIHTITVDDGSKRFMMQNLLDGSIALATRETYLPLAYNFLGCSPDSRFFIFFAHNGNALKGKLILMDTEHLGEQIIVEGNIPWAAYCFSKDGRSICAQDFSCCWQISYDYVFPG